MPIPRLLTALLTILLLSGSGRAIDFAPPLDPLLHARPVAAGAAHSLAIDSAGRVWAWGDNLAGQLGTGDRAARTTPAAVIGLTGSFVAVSAGAGHSLALRTDGSVWAWGINIEGQLGNGTTTGRTTPVRVATLSGVVAIAAGGGHSLAATADGSVWAWGGNLTGQIGDGSSSRRRQPVRVTTLSNVIAVEAGVLHSVAVKADGSVWAWGSNLMGQLGDGTRTMRKRPVAVRHITGARSIAAGAFHSLAVTQSGAVWGWGLNATGQIGDGTTQTRTSPVLLGGLSAIARASAGGGHSVAINASGAAFAWGDNSTGQLGDRSTTRRLTAVPVAQPPATLSWIAAGGAHTIGIAPDASVWSWGNNLLAQLGDGTRTRRLQPAPISGPQSAWGVYPPQFTPAGGTFTSAVSVTISTPTPGATIYYTTTGADPTASDPIFTGTPIPISATTTLKARAVRTGLAPSAIVSATYTFNFGSLDTPVADPPGGSYAQAQSVTLTAEAGATIRYSLDGSEPVASSTLYETPIAIASTTTLRARAFRAGYAPSDVLTAEYVIQIGTPPGEDPPPDPETVAPALSEIELTDFASAQAFLFAGPDPIQRDHMAGSLTAERLTVVRGRVLTREGEPLAGARVRSPEQPAVGHTVSREDGMFDLAVNGGGPVLIEYTRAGFLPSQRMVDTPWQDFVWAPDVRLVALDPVVTRVSMGPQTVAAAARGSVKSDDSGSRQATVIVPEGGVMATIHLPDGSVLPAVSQLSIRATEYTVGPGGPAAMPGALPATSGYTYAVELTADEAIHAGANSVTFDPPLVFYVENFLHFPVGGAAPVGYYDRARSVWIPSNDGRVVGVVGVNGDGEAELDLDGSGEAADAETLAVLGVTSGERKRVALLYAPGQSLWRAPIPHFSPWDINWPFGAPQGAQPPNLDGDNPGPNAPGTRSTQRTGLRPDGQADEPCNESGSIIECQNQTLGELLPIAGTPFALAYRSDRVPGYSNLRTLAIPLTNTAVSASLKRVDLDVTIAGQKHKFEFAPTPGQSTGFTWNGVDAYGRSLNGQQLATATVSHVYNGVYYAGPVNFERSFATPPFPGAPVIGDIARGEVSFPQTMVFGVEARHATQAPVAGWSISAHHRYDARSRVLFMGDGAQRAASSVGDVIETVAGGGETPVENGSVPAREAHFMVAESVAAAGDGSIYLDDGAGILRVASETATRIVTFGEGARDFRPGLAARGDTVIYSYGDIQGDCSEGGSYTMLHVRRLTPNGPGEEIAAFSPQDWTPCTQGTEVAIGTDGGIYVGAGFNVWSIRPNAEPVVIADTFFLSLAAGPAGSLYIGDSAVVRQWRPDGSLQIVAGNYTSETTGDGGRAVDARLGYPFALVADGEGNLLIASLEFNMIDGQHIFATRIRVVLPNGIIEWYAGIPGGVGTTSDDAAGRAANLGTVRGLALAPDGSLYVSRSDSVGALLRLRLPFGATRVPSSDGSSVYEFDLSGRHLRTVDALTGVALLTFSYDTAGRLIGITDRDGLETRITRDGAGTPLSIVSPFGITTTLVVGAGGYLEAVTDAEDRTTSLGYRDGGLLTSLRDANGGVHTFDYDSGGRLLRDADPAGGAQDLSRSDSVNGWTVTRNVADAGTTTYMTQQGSSGTQTRRVIAPDGTETVSLNRGDGSTVMTAADGTETTATLAPDPRFGFAAPFAASTTVRTPAGLTMTVANSKSVTLSNPDNPLSVVSHTETTTLNGRVSRSVFDAAARTITTTSPANRSVVTSLDSLGRPLSVQVGSAMLPTTFTYDATGRLATQTQGARRTTFEYDERGFLGSVTDPLSRIVRFTNDGTGRLLSQTFPDLREATFGYDANGNLTSLTPPGQPAHTMRYTPANQLEEYTAPSVDPAPTMTQYQFNLAMQPTTVTRADGQQISWAYDAAGRPTTLTTPTGATTYAYHPTTGQLSTLASPSGGLAYSYDGALQTAETSSGFTVGAVSWNYDASFRVTTERVNGANAITFGYDSDSLLTSAGALTYTRRATDGLLLTATLDSAVTTFTYSGFGELATEESRHGAAVLYGGVYTRDDGGRLSERTETIGGTTTTDGYGYDLAGRLTTVTRGGAPFAAYTYDANGNRTGVTTSAGTIAATYDDQDRLVTFGDRTYTHTGHGEVRSWSDASGTTTLTYDVHGNLLAVTLPSGTMVEYIVDARNRRIGRSVNGVRTSAFLYQGLVRPIAELDGDGNLVSRFVYGARPTAPEYMVRNGERFRLLVDHLGSVRLVVNDATGVIAQRLDYDAWGQIITDTNPRFQPFAFAGGLYDPLTNLIRFGTRDYDPATGRWLAKDRIGFKGGDTNLFSYVADDPINAADPAGLQVVMVNPSAVFPKPEWLPDWLWEMFEQPDVMVIAPSPFGMACRIATKAVNLPAWRTVAIDMAHILRRHGADAHSTITTKFPAHMTEQTIERVVREAYRYGEKIATQGDSVLMRGEAAGLSIEMWINKATRTILTAYPLP